MMTYNWDSVYDNLFVGLYFYLLLHNLRSKASAYIPSAPSHEKNSSFDIFDYIFWFKTLFLLLGRGFFDKNVIDYFRLGEFVDKSAYVFKD